MELTKHLTDRQKAESLDILIKRDEGYCCWYCKKPFSLSQSIKAPHLFDHLNNNRTDNRIDNVVLCCESCNRRKVDDFDMEFLAKDKLHDNEKRDYMREKFENKTRNREDSEVRISKTNYQICYLYVIKKVDQFGQIDFKKTVQTVVWRCRQNNNTGSEQSVYKYLAIMCNEEAPYEIVKIDGKKVIRKRKSAKVNTDSEK